MDEPVLRALIQKLTKRLLPEFEKVSDAEERMSLVLQQPEFASHALLVEDLGLANDWPQKNDEVAKRNREDGNSAFTSGNHELAITLYTEAMKYAGVHETLWEGETMAIAAANRSACHFQLKNYRECLTDIELALEAGYPIQMCNKLYIRQCKCLLELSRIPEAQVAFDKAIDAIDRSGLQKDLRKDKTADLQEAFINLAKSVEADPPPELLAAERNRDATGTFGEMPAWSIVKDPHPNYPSASSAVTIKYDPNVGRHIVANRDIEVGEVLFHESPIVTYHMAFDPDILVTPACHNCFMNIRTGLVPCPTCSTACFCSIGCRNEALASYHKYECRIASLLVRTQLHRLPLVMASLRGITQKSVAFFKDAAEKEVFSEHDVTWGSTPDQVYKSDDYRSLFNLVTHMERRTIYDVVTKHIIAAILVAALKGADFFPKAGDEAAEVLIGKILAHFLQCIQFNMHMVDSVFSNRLIAPDSETRVWKCADKFAVGEVIETHPVGGAVYPTLAAINHSCDPNITLVNFGKKAVALSVRQIKAGAEINDSYGSVYHHMDKAERQQFLQNSYWFECGCAACTNNWTYFLKLPRDYFKLSGAHFKYKRCNRKQLQKDVDKLKKRIRTVILDERVPVTMKDEVPNHFEAARMMFNDWMTLLDELLNPASHQDFVTAYRGMRNCLWLQSPNIVKVRESDVLKETKAKYRQEQAGASS